MAKPTTLPVPWQRNSPVGVRGYYHLLVILSNQQLAFMLMRVGRTLFDARYHLSLSGTQCQGATGCLAFAWKAWQNGTFAQCGGGGI